MPSAAKTSACEPPPPFSNCAWVGMKISWSCRSFGSPDRRGETARTLKFPKSHFQTSDRSLFSGKVPYPLQLYTVVYKIQINTFCDQICFCQSRERLSGVPWGMVQFRFTGPKKNIQSFMCVNSCRVISWACNPCCAHLIKSAEIFICLFN